MVDTEHADRLARRRATYTPRSQLPPAALAAVQEQDNKRRAIRRTDREVNRITAALKNGGNFLICETVGDHERWTLADRNGGELDPEACQTVVTQEPPPGLEAVRIVRQGDGVTVYGCRDMTTPSPIVAPGPGRVTRLRVVT